MEWITKLLLDPTSIAHIVVLYALVICLGVKLGKIKIGGISLGVTFVLFVGIIAGHIFKSVTAGPGAPEMAVPKETLGFISDFGLILFVYCIGLQVGPGFFASFKKGGLAMNLLACGIVVLDIAVMLGLYYILFASRNDPKDLPMMVGVLYGAVTNTPGLGAATGTLPASLSGLNIGSGYACAYPLGVVGIIGATIALRYICRINLKSEENRIKEEQESNPHATPCHLVLRVTNQAVVGKSLMDLRSGKDSHEFVCSRCIKDGEMFIPNRDTVLEMGMEVYMVCSQADADAITLLFGEALDVDWKAVIADSQFVSKRILVTKPRVTRKTIGQMHFSSVYGVNVTRVTRSGMDLFADRNLHLQIGDRIMVTGSEENVSHMEDIMGNSIKRLDAPNVGAIFFGILLGVFLGQIPIPLPGVAVPVKLGLAGGPLVVAILIGAFGYKFKISSYTTTSANLLLREIGLILFLASVGIKAGATFWDTIMKGDGLTYVWAGFLITIIPILIIGTIARLKYKFDYFTIMGFIAGSHTDPPALAFANQTANNDAPSVGYSTVYPLTMFLRILTAQLILIFLCQ